ncbi:MAG: BamA/TamA family outer membrane protein [Bacteroidota bacterium]|nr:BamA/TamA family outer membrane protein [Bacteroidota bacterium]
MTYANPLLFALKRILKSQIKIRQFFLMQFSFFTFLLLAQEPDTISSSNKEIVRTGFSPVGIPLVSYNSDIGFKYGALVNLYWYGDGSRYPQYDHSIYVQLSRTTKGNGINQITYESDKLMPGIRSLFEASLLTEKALNFYGFNGYQAVYDLDFEKEELDQLGNSNRLYYRHSRRLFRLKADFQGEIFGQELRWLGGIAYYGSSIDSVDIDKLNEGKDKNLLSHNSLYGNYVEWGLIPGNQANGGNHTILKGGLIYDTRDNEPNPFKGVWSEIQFHYAPSFLSNTDYSYARIILTHRQYFTLLPEWINLAYRVSYQGKIAGEMPFYMMPFVFQTAPKLTRDGVGGARTVRGVRRNRIVGDGFVYGNFEVRGNILKTNVLNQNFYIALSVFADGGMVTQKYNFDASGMPDELPDELPDEIIAPDAKEIPHLGMGGGIHFILNHNFIITVNYGCTLKKSDGDRGLYTNMKYLF